MGSFDDAAEARFRSMEPTTAERAAEQARRDQVSRAIRRQLSGELIAEDGTEGSAS